MTKSLPVPPGSPSDSPLITFSNLKTLLLSGAKAGFKGSPASTNRLMCKIVIRLTLIGNLV